MNIKTAIAAGIAAASIVALSACTASDQPALEKGQGVDGNGQPVEQVEAEAVPQECGEAFDDAVDISTLLGEALDVSADAVGYALDLDYLGLDDANAELEALVEPLEDARNDYNAAAATCRLAEPPQDCTSALDSAEEVDDLLSQGLDSASRSLQYAIDYNAAGLDEETAVIADLTEDVKVARDNFLAQSASCTISEGA